MANLRVWNRSLDQASSKTATITLPFVRLRATVPNSRPGAALHLLRLQMAGPASDTTVSIS